MDNFVELSHYKDLDGNVDFLINKTKNNYINFGGINNDDAIECVHSFLCKHGIWEETDQIVYNKKLSTLVPDAKKYHNISFVITFYNASSKTNENKLAQHIGKRLAIDRENLTKEREDFEQIKAIFKERIMSFLSKQRSKLINFRDRIQILELQLMAETHRANALQQILMNK